MSESLTQRVRRVRDESGSVDPRELADKVLATLDSPKLLREALVECLPGFVRITAGRDRMAAFTAQPAVSSGKVSAVRSWHDRLLAAAVDVSGGRGEWKALADCTRADLLVAAAHRRSIAAKNTATADTYEHLAGLLKGGATVARLDESTLAAVFGRAAA